MIRNANQPVDSPGSSPNAFKVNSNVDNELCNHLQTDQATYLSVIWRSNVHVLERSSQDPLIESHVRPESSVLREAIIRSFLSGLTIWSIQCFEQLCNWTRFWLPDYIFQLCSTRFGCKLRLVMRTSLFGGGSSNESDLKVICWINSNVDTDLWALQSLWKRIRPIFR